MEFHHKPVLFKETLEGLQIRPDGVYIDGTAGGGGHSAAIAARLTTGRLIAIDQDPDAVATASERLKPFSCAKVVQANFSQVDEVARESGIQEADGILLDIGVSSHQLDIPERGFSYHHDAPLDMRMSQRGTTAADLVNQLSWQQLAEIFSRFGEEKYSKNIAQAIVRKREAAPVKTTGQLVEIIKEAVPAKVKRENGHPARRVFQALRIAVNGELESLETGLRAAMSLVRPGGRIAVITFHSLEDRIVKETFRQASSVEKTDPRIPLLPSQIRQPDFRLVSRKPILPGEEELAENNRSHSAKLRVLERIGD